MIRTFGTYVFVRPGFLARWRRVADRYLDVELFLARLVRQLSRRQAI
jgi:hypothetical protein